MHLSRAEQNIGTTISSFAVLLFLVYLSLGILGTDDEILILSSIAISLLVAFSICFFVQYRLRRQGKISEIDYLNIGIQRYFLGLFMVFYGVPKLFGNFFDYQLFALDSKLAEVSEFELAWYYFGKKNWQELLSGILEFVPGLLLFSRRTYYVASLILLFVTSQVFMLNLFFKIGGVTFPAATILLACNMYIIYSQKQSIINFFRSLNFAVDTSFGKTTKVVLKTLKFVMLALVLFVIFIKARPAMIKTAYQRKYETLVGKYTLDKITRNHAPYLPSNDSNLYRDIYIEKQSRWNILRRCNGKTSAFILQIRGKNDSIAIYINEGGIGDGPDIIDSVTALKGTYSLHNDQLVIHGIQQKDTLDLIYVRQDLEPKKWIW